MKTIAQHLKIKDFPFEIKDKDGNTIYSEDYAGRWIRREYDSDGNKRYLETYDNYWEKYEYDSEGNQRYYEDSDGKIVDNRPKEIITLNGIKYQRVDE